MSKYLHKIPDLICKDVIDKTLCLSWTPIIIENTKVLYRLNILTKNNVKISVNNISKNYFNFTDPDANFNQKYSISIIPYIQDTNYPFHNYIDDQLNNTQTSLSNIINLPNIIAIGSESDKLIITTDLEPIKLNINVDSLSIDLSWNNIIGAIKYTIKYLNNEIDTINNFYKLEQLEPNTDYTIQIIAHAENSKNNSETTVKVKTNIHKLFIDENSFSILDKTYDGNNTAHLSNMPLFNYSGNKNISINLISSEFITSNFNTNIKSITKFNLNHPDFILVNDTVEKYANINKKELICNVIALDKIYDSTNKINVIINNINGIVNNDNVIITPIGVSNDSNVKAYTNVDITFELNNNNYFIKPITKTININPKELLCNTVIQPKLCDNNNIAIIDSYDLIGLVNNEKINISINGTYENNKANENSNIFIKYHLSDDINKASNYFIKNTIKNNLVKLNPIENLSANKISDNSLELSWTDNKNIRDDIISYQIIFNGVKLYTQNKSILINGLIPNTFYTFNVYVLSKMPKCCSEPKSINAKTVNNLSKDDIKFDLITSNTILLSWPHMGKNFNYFISYSINNNYLNSITVETSDNFIELNNLSEATTYYIKIQPKQQETNFSIIEIQKNTLPMFNLLNQHNNTNNVINLLNIFRPLRNLDFINTSIFSTTYMPFGTIFRGNYLNDIKLITGEYANKIIFSKSINSSSIKNNNQQFGINFIVNTIPINNEPNVLHKFHLNAYNSTQKIINNINLTYSVDYINNTEFPINHILLKLYKNNVFIGNLNKNNNNTFSININETLLNYSDSVFYIVRELKEVVIYANHFHNTQLNDVLLFDNKDKNERVKIYAKLKTLSKDDLETAPFVLNTMNNFNYIKYITLHYNDEKIIIDMDTLQSVNGNNEDYNNYKLKQYKYLEYNIITSNITSDKYVLDKYYTWLRKKNLGNKLNFDGKIRTIHIKGNNVNYYLKLASDKNCADIRNEISFKGDNMFLGSGAFCNI
jgi:hypothetical protein